MELPRIAKIKIAETMIEIPTINNPPENERLEIFPDEDDEDCSLESSIKWSDWEGNEVGDIVKVLSVGSISDWISIWFIWFEEIEEETYPKEKKEKTSEIYWTK